MTMAKRPNLDVVVPNVMMKTRIKNRHLMAVGKWLFAAGIEHDINPKMIVNMSGGAAQKRGAGVMAFLHHSDLAAQGPMRPAVVGNFLPVLSDKANENQSVTNIVAWQYCRGSRLPNVLTFQRTERVTVLAAKGRKWQPRQLLDIGVEQMSNQEQTIDCRGQMSSETNNGSCRTNKPLEHSQAAPGPTFKRKVSNDEMNSAADKSKNSK
ncbi:hypothetical protein HAX54_025623 [Datura stramonium]|uniref:Uncharacterized protein n=1 Tax=Datura stramonium TaxID=4076 RepID=A0ABS8V1V0_DATST|nr:hypothetical protein [Datura stramonium]